MSSSYSNYTLGRKFSGGTYCAVFEAFRVPDGKGFVIKKNRASSKIKRTILLHEARIMQTIQGHPSLPRLLGYGRANHFEVIAMDRLGGTVEKKVTSNGRSLLPLTVARIGEQMLSALRHLHTHNIVHRDIKPDNMLLSLEDPSRVILIDFNISIRVLPGRNGEPQKPLSGKHGIVGSLHWCSLNAHKHLPLQTQDDVESLAYLLLFLLRTELPWMKEYRNEHSLQRISRVGATKQAYSGADLSAEFPNEFGQLLNHARTSWAEGDHTRRILESTQHVMYQLAMRLGLSNAAAPLDWSPGDRIYSRLVATEDAAPYRPPEDDEDDDDDYYDVEEYSNSYWLPDFMKWMALDRIATGRSKELTFPTFDAKLLDEQIPTIPVVHDFPLESYSMY